ncbi:toxin TcdB middle/N-terminal domain-containing protein [Flexibacterium corallicola]|uniref:toxin TcdB middle/N-terminal domain-containing protein n=1 Tax=Flexibacterium corallicola TaxID=3037259 RepID=UPI00286F2E28|nr:toxin TcdB middle/N-terminal domain-containing protein [Pseudovibrio sp. M1P-2-3]
MAAPSGTESSILPLPKGGGAQSSIDESFQTNLNTGSGFYQIPIKLPKGVNDHTPSLALKYTSGHGMGPYGLGWSLRLPSITASFDRRLPDPSDSGDPDFLMDGRELVAIGGGLYRPLAEAEFSRIKKLPADAGWEVNTKQGQTLTFGISATSRSGRDGKVREWHLDAIEDINGNTITFSWENDKGQAYLKSVDYAIYQLVLKYEERPDPFSTFRSGYEIRTTMRCRSIDLFLNEPHRQAVKTYRLHYSQAEHSGLSLLTKVQLVAQDQPISAGPISEMPLPPVELSYASFKPDARQLETLDDGLALPPSLSRSDTTLLDYAGTGRPGIIQMNDGKARFWPNNGRDGWGAPKTLDELPPFADLASGGMLFADMDGNGTADLVEAQGPLTGYYANKPGEGWGQRTRYRHGPSSGLAGAQNRLLDLDGDARVDLLSADRTSFYHYYNKGAGGWEQNPTVTLRKHDLEVFPDVDLADPHIRFADVVGDGRSHLVAVYSRSVFYYPNLGYGRWGERRRMTNAPVLPRGYDPARLFLADVDGSGAADILYVDYDRIYIWINRSGNGFSDPVIVAGTPPLADAAILIADMKGTGTQGVLWSYEASLRKSQAYRYLDLCAGSKPYLLKSIRNNVGVETQLSYASSCDWQRDQDDPDIEGSGFLPFPVPVVRALEVSDPHTGVTSRSEFSYWNGHFDGKTRRFAGFGKGERRDIGDDTVPTLRTTSYFHTQDIALRHRSFLTRVFGEDDTPNAHRPFSEEEVTYAVSEVGQSADGQSIRHVAETEKVSRKIERSATANEIRIEQSYDAFGNVSLARKTSSWVDDEGTPQQSVLVTSTTHTSNEAEWLVGLPVRTVVRDGNGAILSASITYYDGPDFFGLPEGHASNGNISRERKLALLPAHNTLGLDDAGLAAHGYIKENDPELGLVFFVDDNAQSFGAGGILTRRKDARGFETHITFDAHGLYPAMVSLANNSSVSAEYEYKYGSMTSYRDQNGIDQLFDYDIAGRLITAIRYDDLSGQPYLEHQYGEGASPPHTVTLTRSQPGGAQHTKVEYFDGVGEVLQTRSEAEDGKILVSGRKDYNVRGLPIREFEPYFGIGMDFSLADQTNPNLFTSYRYDALGRSTQRLDWEGLPYRSQYTLGETRHFDPSDLGLTPNANASDTPRSDWMDPEEQVVAVLERTETGTYATRNQFDPAGQRVQVSVNGDVHTQNTYDCLGRRIKSVYRDAGTQLYFYDAAGNLVERVDGNGARVHRTFDALGRILELRHGGPAGTLEETYHYDQGEPGEEHTKGQLTKVTGPFGEVRYTYGRCGCIKTKTRIFPGLAQEQTVTYKTDSLKRFTKIIYPDGFEQDFAYNDGGLITSIVGVIDRIDYTATGRRKRIEYTSGVITEYEYAAGSQYLLRIKTSSPDGTITYQDTTNTYDALGRLSAITDSANVPGHLSTARDFTYDSLSQLLQENGVDENGAYTHDYSYDANGNITSYPESFGHLALEHDDPAHPYRLSAIDGIPAGYTYDNAGNITATPDCQFTFDARNRLIRVEHTNGTVVTHLYDHNSNRVVTRVTVGAVTDSQFNFDDIYLIEGMTATKMVFDENKQIALIRQNGSGVVYHKDHLGSHVASSELQTGAFIAQTSYYAFGKISKSGAIEGPFRYNGKKFDELPKLVFFGGRYYLPELGRFLTPDPYYLEEQPDKFFNEPRSLQLYTYVLNNPLNMIDPYGLWFGIDDAIVAVVGFVVGAVSYVINWAVSGGDFQWSEFIMSGLMGAATIWAAWTLTGPVGALIVGAAMLAKPAITGALDQASMGNGAGDRFLGFLSFAIKFASAPLTTTIGLLIGFFGIGFGLWGRVEWFRGGVIAFEHNAGGAGFSAVTLGGSVNIWSGNTNDPLFAHELYHSRQYTYFGDAFIPMWILGGIYGLLSSAIAGNPQWSCFNSGNPNAPYGNPLEDGAHAAARGGGCT